MGALFAAMVIVAIMLAFDPLGEAVLADGPRLVVRLAGWITQLGDSALWLVPSGIGVAALACLAPRPARLDAGLRQLSLRLGFLFAAVAGTGLVANLVKRSVGRLRPHHVADGLTLQFEPFAWSARAASFPSGHATTAAAVATVMVLLAGRKAWPFAIGLVVLVGLSRVVVGAHFLADVAAGTLLGTVGTLWLARVLASRGLVFRALPSGALAPRGRHAAKALRARFARKGAP